MKLFQRALTQLIHLYPAISMNHRNLQLFIHTNFLIFSICNLTKDFRHCLIQSLADISLKLFCNFLHFCLGKFQCLFLTFLFYRFFPGLFHFFHLFHQIAVLHPLFFQIFSEFLQMPPVSNKLIPKDIFLLICRICFCFYLSIFKLVPYIKKFCQKYNDSYRQIPWSVKHNDRKDQNSHHHNHCNRMNTPPVKSVVRFFSSYLDLQTFHLLLFLILLFFYSVNFLF